MVKKVLKSVKTRKAYKGGSDFGPPSYNASTANPYTTYDLNVEPDPSRAIISTRNLVGGKKRRKSKRKSRKGLSTHLDHFGEPDSAAILFGQAEAPYLIADMAADGAELVRVLGLGAQHVVGVSMGGMIAQQFAINFPELTLSLTSIMSTPAPLEVGTSTPECLAMLTRPRSQDLETFLVEEIENWQLTNGSAHPLDEAWVRDQAITAMNRGRNPIGVLRHLCAVVASPDRRPALSKLTVPVLVLHGDEDPLVTPSGGEATAAAIPHATHVVYPGMGHSLPEPVWDVVAAEIVAVADLA